jgi:eukaryotic-like serine/threonine-protein kinase
VTEPTTDVPETLGKYRVLKEIGRGTMGVVYLGEDPLQQRSVALKVAHQPDGRDASAQQIFRSLFLNEMRVATILSHPNIVEVLDAGIDGAHYYIAMEHLDGSTTLEQWCHADNLLPLERVAEVVFKCAQALDYAHRHGVIHRDVKPANILLAANGDVKLADFSVALLTDPGIDETQLLRPVGSPLYMSPEQLLEGEVTNQSDLFSLGNVLYELLTGTLPFAANTLAGVTHKVLRVPPPPLSTYRSGVPDSLQHIVTKALARDPVDRFDSAVDFAAALSLAFSEIHSPTVNLALESRSQVMKNLAFFANFKDAEIWELLRWAHWQEYAADATIIAEDDDSDHVFVLIEGHVLVTKHGKPVRALTAGECFGEIAFLGERRRSATVTATSAVAVMRLSAATIAQASLKCQVQFQRVFIRTLLERLVATTEDLVQQDRD